MGIFWLPEWTWIAGVPTLVFQLEGQVSSNLHSSSIQATKEVLLRAVVWWVNLRCYWCPIPGHEDLHYRETLRSSIKMTFIDCEISPRPAKNLSIGEIHSKPAVTRVLHQPTQGTEPKASSSLSFPSTLESNVVAFVVYIIKDPRSMKVSSSKWARSWSFLWPYLSDSSGFLLAQFPQNCGQQCLKITQKVSFYNISSAQKILTYVRWRFRQKRIDVV